MYSMIIIFFISFITLFYFIKRENLNLNIFSEDGLMLTIMCGLFSIALSVAGLLISGMIASIIAGERKITNTTNIVSLSNKTETEGGFVIGNGSVEGVEYYYYFIFNGTGYIRGKIPVNSSIIIESDDVKPNKGVEGNVRNPVIEIETTVLPQHLENWFFVPCPNPYNKIIVPVGTVVQRFSVN